MVLAPVLVAARARRVEVAAAVNWGVVNHVLMAVGENGRRYTCEVVHGRLWLAVEHSKDGRSLIEGEYFGGPECARAAREWCEKRGKIPRGRKRKMPV